MNVSKHTARKAKVCNMSNTYCLVCILFPVYLLCMGMQFEYCVAKVDPSNNSEDYYIKKKAVIKLNTLVGQP